MLGSDSNIEVLEGLGEADAGVDADVLIGGPASLPAPWEGPGASRGSGAWLLLADAPLAARRMLAMDRAWGILPTDSSAEELVAAVHALAQGLIVGTKPLLFDADEEALPARGPLTERESEVLALLARGLANKQIAVALGISEHTVKFHVSSIYTKLNVANRTEAVRAGLRGGWIAL